MGRKVRNMLYIFGKLLNNTPLKSCELLDMIQSAGINIVCILLHGFQVSNAITRFRLQKLS
jgi:hypothetical protein